VASAKNEMAVGSGLSLLGRAGYIQREYAPGSRTYTTRLSEPRRPLEELPIDFETLDAKLQRDLAKLRRMVDYPDYRDCRHYFVLDYFGDTTAARRCAVCDNCLSRSAAVTRLPTAEETVIVQKALSCVGRMSGRFGRGRVTQTLVGSRSKEVLDAGLDRLSTYGLLAEEGADYVWSLIETLIHAGCIAVSGDQYPTLSLTPLGHEVVHRRTTIPLAMPMRMEEMTKPARRARHEKAGSMVREAAAGHGPLFEALRQWRREKAAAMGNVPAYVVYPDATLAELARLMPQSPEQLLEVRGIGPAKAKRFGRETLAVIHAFRQSSATGE
jgi:ATP-dependent DNA helicase RecQ